MPDPYGPEAKEFLRQRLVGSKVKVSMDYSRQLQVMGGGDGGEATARGMDFGSVTLLEEKANDEGQQPNIGEMLVLRGLATVVRHRGDEERAANYEALMQAEAKALKNKKGLHSAKEAPASHVNDLSQRDATQKARSYLPFLQRSGRVSAVVEAVLSGHRMKLYVPKENVMIVFSLAGVRAPGKLKDVAEPFSDEALSFSRHLCLQRDVEVEIETVDKTGTFLGTMVCGRTHVGTALLDAGLASLHPMFNADRAAHGGELRAAEARAKEKRLKLWSSWDPEKEAAAAAEADGGDGGAPAGGRGAEVWEVVVTEVRHAGELYVQRVEKAAAVAAVAEQLAGLGLKEQPATGGVGFVPTVGTICCARFTEDDAWYRAKVEEVADDKADVFYLDFGNRERLPTSKLAPLDAPALAVAACPPLAVAVQLAGVKVPSLEEDFGYEAGQMLSELVMGKTLQCTVELREKSAEKRAAETTLVTLRETGGEVPSVNEELVQAGLARCVRPRNRRIGAVVDALKPAQEAARAARANIWQYGDIDSDDDM